MTSSDLLDISWYETFGQISFQILLLLFDQLEQTLSFYMKNLGAFFQMILSRLLVEK